MRLVTPIPLTLDRPRAFLLDLRAMALAEREIAKAWGQPRASLFEVFQSGKSFGLTDLACLVWAGLSREDATLTVDGVLDLLGQHGIAAASAAIATAFREQLGATVGEAAEAPANPPPSTGSASGPAAGSTSA